MKIFPISYYSIFLVVLLCINKKKASYFYPFMVTTSVLGIVSVIVGFIPSGSFEYMKVLAFNGEEKLKYYMIILHMKQEKNGLLKQNLEI